MKSCSSIRNFPIRNPYIGKRQILAVLYVASILFSAAISAQNGRDFAGFYDISNVNALGDSVSLTLTARIFNYSEGPVSGATVFLTDPLLLFEKYGELGVMSVNDRDSVVLQHDFSIPGEVYELWQQGLHPLLQVEYTNGAGMAVHSPVELINLPVGLEGQP